jgi:hypothetical protein
MFCKKNMKLHVFFNSMFCGGVPSLKLRPYPWENQDQPLAYLSALSRSNTFLYLYKSKRKKMKKNENLAAEQ